MGLAAPGCVLVDFRPQFLSRRFAGFSQLLRDGRGMVDVLQQRGLLAGFNVEVVLADDGVTR